MEGNLHMTTEPRQEPPGEEGPYARRMNRESSVSYMDCLFSVLVGSEQTDGRFGLMEMVAPKGREPSRHLHYTDDEGFYVLEASLPSTWAKRPTRPVPARSCSCPTA